ncbi:uncharacterized protein EV420DRAFT_1748556 [Desarmillaria tabescens]|uniref:Uncharacterized protein n=1 Tax=Armillaria tabescens TaxID=1929756 RepID=A0AA39KFK4_ARMTA|nr:uncharacterized protein EV420DRAFT_1748556 [Desarmillaria tabescens]KAK0457858.1 hypothetical protein EV420DRAFT_1748556 [Desarmillaria tabescens]
MLDLSALQHDHFLLQLCNTREDLGRLEICDSWRGEEITLEFRARKKESASEKNRPRGLHDEKENEVWLNSENSVEHPKDRLNKARQPSTHKTGTATDQAMKLAWAKIQRKVMKTVIARAFP